MSQRFGRAMSASLSGGEVKVDLDHREVAAEDELKRETSGWFCLRVKPWRCGECGTIYKYAMCGGEHGEHEVVVWPSRDDPNMRRWMREEFNGEAAIVSYEQSFGPAISFYAIRQS